MSNQLINFFCENFFMIQEIFTKITTMEICNYIVTVMKWRELCLRGHSYVVWDHYVSVMSYIICSYNVLICSYNVLNWSIGPGS